MVLFVSLSDVINVPGCAEFYYASHVTDNDRRKHC